MKEKERERRMLHSVKTDFINERYKFIYDTWKRSADQFTLYGYNYFDLFGSFGWPH